MTGYEGGWIHQESAYFYLMSVLCLSYVFTGNSASSPLCRASHFRGSKTLTAIQQYHSSRYLFPPLHTSGNFQTSDCICVCSLSREWFCDPTEICWCGDVQSGFQDPGGAGHTSQRAARHRHRVCLPQSHCLFCSRLVHSVTIWSFLCTRQRITLLCMFFWICLLSYIFFSSIV